MSLIYKTISKNKNIIKEKVKPLLISQKSKNVIHSENLINILKEVLIYFNLTNTQWKIIVGIGDTDRSSMIDFDLFINLATNSAKKATSHPKLS